MAEKLKAVLLICLAMGPEDAIDLQLRLPPGLKGPDVVTLAEESYELDRLFRMIQRSQPVQRMLFLSKHDLFEVEDEHQVPVFHTCRSDDTVGDMLAAIIDESGQPTTDLAEILEGGLGSSRGLMGLIDAFAYAIFAAGAADPQLRNLMSSGKVTFTEWRRLVREAGGLDEFVDRLADRSRDQLANNREYQRFVRDRTEEVTRVAAERMDQLAIAAKQALPDMLVQLHGVAYAWITRIQNLAGITREEIDDVLGIMVKLNIVETKSAIAWCPSCQLERPAYQILAGTWAPKRYASHVCFVCKAPVNYAAILFPLDDFRDALLSRDGLLGAFVAWRLSETNRLEESFFHASGSEWDFLTTDGTLIEIKMFQTSRGTGTLRRSLGEAVNRVKKALPGLLKEKPAIQQFVLVTNLPEALVEAYNSKGQSLDGVPIRVTGVDGGADV